MMKKLLLLSSALFTFFGAVSQTPGPVSTPTTVTDTLQYFTNKQKYKLGGIMDVNLGVTNFSYFQAPSSDYAAFTGITQFGSIFKNKDTALMVTGLEGWASRDYRSLRPNLQVNLYLCKINPATGLPIMPPLDTVITQINNNCNVQSGACPPVLLGGPLKHGPKKVSGDFAVMIQHASTRSGDTVRFYRTTTFTKDNAYNGPNADFYKTGERLGVVRKGGQFFSTTHYIGNTGFGWGTDYEFCVAPRVQFNLQVSQLEPGNAQTACVAECISYTNTSSPEFTNRQFNMNEFYRHLQPFVAGPSTAPFYPDSVLRWYFDDDHRLDTVPFRWGRVQDIFLGKDTNVMCKYFDTAGVFPNGTLIGKYRKMSGSYSTRITGQTVFGTTVDLCGAVDGIRSNGTLSNVNVYPNPAVNGKVAVSGLRGKNTVVVYDMLGQVIYSEVSEKENVMVDLLKQPAGTYMIRVTNSENRTKNVKVINQKN